MKNLFLILLFSALIAIPALMKAQPAGTLDPDFGVNGKLTLDNGYLDLLTDVELQSDGKIVTIGIVYDASFVASARALRFMPDGTADDTFGTNGVFSYSLNFEANVFGCAIRPNGKIVMTGSTTDYNDYRLLLIQIDENGVLDPSFGNNGVVVQQIGPNISFFEDHSYAIALQDDGKVVVAGKSYNENYQFRPVVVRFTEDGQLDTGFGTNGVSSIPVTEVENDFDGLLIQDDGKIIASGHIANTFLSFAMLVARFMPDGALDASFGNGGYVNYAYSNVDDEGFAIALTPENEYLVTGFTATASYNFSMLLMKFDQQGNLVNGFGDAGIVVSDLGQYDVGNDICLMSNGKILVAGASGDMAPGDFDMAVWRYNPNGTLDDSFGEGGVAKIQFNGQPDEALAMAHQSDGKILIAGKARGTNNFDFAMARLLNDFSTTIPENSATSLAVFPNPVNENGQITLQFEVPQAANVALTIYSSQGTCIGEVELGYLAEGFQTYSLKVPGEVKPGVYYLKINNISTSVTLLVTK